MSELTHIFLCAVLKSLEIALQAHFSIKDTLAISECRNEDLIKQVQNLVNIPGHNIFVLGDVNKKPPS